MKAAAVCLLLVAFAAISVEGYNQTRIIGNVRYGDRLLDLSSVYKPGRLNHVVVSNYQYPKFGSAGLISCIKVLDRILDGTNGDLYLNSGGVGQRKVSMSIRSKKGYGINYNVEIWGR